MRKKLKFANKLIVCAIAGAVLASAMTSRPSALAAGPMGPVLNPKIRQEINLIDAVTTATSSAISQLDTTKYDGASYYFETVAKVTSGTASLCLLRKGTTTCDSAISEAHTSYTLQRSNSFSPPAGQTEYVLGVSGGTGTSVIAARIVILNTASSFTKMETQIEIGNQETGKTNTATSTLVSPKYWYYDATKWDGTVTAYAEATYQKTDNTPIYSASSTIYAAAGTFNWTAPAGATSTIVDLWGGGGAGGAGTNNPGAGSGGAAGCFASSTIATTPGNTYQVVVGAGGTIVSNGAGNRGATSTWASTGVVAVGGAGGAADTGAPGAGSTTGCVGTTKIAGGSGEAGSTASGYGGKGGDAGAGGGAGGARQTTANLAGNPGTAPGGGGGGGYTTKTANQQGAGGADGRARLSYYYQSATDTSPTIFTVLQEDNGSFANWADKATIVADGNATTATRARVAFTPTSGRNYRLAFRITSTNSSYDIYNAKIVIDQTNNPTKYETQYLLANTALAAGTNLQNFLTKWDSTEWFGVANTYIHEVSASSTTTSVVEVDTAGGAQVGNSSISSISYRKQSGALTMPADGNLDVKATTNNNGIYASRILVQVTPIIQMVTISGTVYSDEGTTASTSPRTVYMSIDGAALVSTTTVNGLFTFSTPSSTTAKAITVFMAAAGTTKAAVVTRGLDDSSNITGLDLYFNKLIVRHEDSNPITNTEIAAYDKTKDGTNLFFTSNSNNLALDSGFELHVWTGKTYTAGGTVTTQGTGDFHIATSSTAFLDVDNNVIGRNVIIGNGGAVLHINANTTISGGSILTSGSGAADYTAGTPTLTVSGTGTVGGGTSTLAFYSLAISGSGTVSINATTTIAGNLTVNSGATLNGSGSITVSGGNTTGDGNINRTGGFFEMRGTGNFGGNTGWTFNNLNIGNAIAASTTMVGSGSVTVNGSVTIGSTSKLGGAKDLSVGGTWTNSGTFYPGSSTVTFNGATTTTITAGTGGFANLAFNNASGQWTISDADLTVTGNLTMATGTLLSSNNITVQGGSVSGNGTINAASGNFTVTGTGSFGGSRNWTFNNLIFGGSGTATTTATGSGSITASSTMVSSNQVLDAGPKTFNLNGATSTPLAVSGSLIASTSTFSFWQTIGTTTIPVLSYYNLDFSPTSGTPIFALAAPLVGGAADTGVRAPTAVIDPSGFPWANPTYAYTPDDTNFATANVISPPKMSDYKNFGFSIPADATIQGIEADVRAYCASANCSLLVKLMGSFQKSTGLLSGVNTDYVLGGNGDLWGGSWQPSDFSDANFLIRAQSSLSAAGTLYLDSIQVKVYYSTPSTGNTVTVSNNLSLNGAGNETLDFNTNDPSLIVNGNVVIGSGDAFLASDSATTTISGNLTINGTFTHNNGILAFDGSATSTITSAASVSFNNLAVTTPGKALAFQKHTANVPLFTVAGTLTAIGSAQSPVSLVSNTPNSQWLVHFNSAQPSGNVTYAYIKDSGCDGSSQNATLDATAINGGNNGTCWVFPGSGVTISGYFYSGEGTGPLASKAIAVRVNGSGSYSGTTNGSGFYTVSAVSLSQAGDVVTVYADNVTEKAVTVTKVKDTSSNIPNLDLYQNHVILRQEGTSAITINDAASCATCDFSDIVFVAATTTPPASLTVSLGNELYIWPGTTFNPGGGVFTNNNGGDLHLVSATATLDSTGTIGRDVIVDVGSTLHINANISVNGGDITTAATSTVDYTAGTPTVTVSGTGNIGGGSKILTFYNFATSGSGSISLVSTTTVNNNLTVGSGTTLSGSANVTAKGNTTGDGAVNFTGGTFLLDGSGNFGGSGNWTFNNLQVGNGTAATTTATGTGSITISGILTVAGSAALDAGSKTWTLQGGGTPLAISGAFDANASTMVYSGALTATVTPMTYYNLNLNSASGNPSFALPANTAGPPGSPTGTPATIASAGTVSDATGRPTQNHLFYAQNSGRWWMVYADSANSSVLRTAYSSDLSSWTTGAATTTAFAVSSGIDIGVAYKNISNTDVAYVTYMDTRDNQHEQHYFRATISGTTFTWGSSAKVVPGGDGNYGTIRSLGNNIALSSSNYVYVVGSALTNGTSAWGNFYAGRSNGADPVSGESSFTTQEIGADAASTVRSFAAFPLAGGAVLAISDNGQNADSHTNLWSSKYTTSWAARANVYASSYTGTDFNDWTAVKISDTDIRVFMRSGNQTFSTRQYNGSSWVATSAPPNFPTAATKAGAGIFAASDGANVWLFAMDNAAGNQIYYVKYNGSSWDASWTSMGFSAQTRNYLSGYQNLANNDIGLVWSQTNGSNYDAIAAKLSTQPAPASTVPGIKVNGNLTLGDGSHTVTIDALTNNSSLDLKGNLIVNDQVSLNNGSGSIIFSSSSPQAITDNGSTKLNLGNLTISGSSTTLNSSIKATSLTVNAGKVFSLNNANTLTLTGTGSPLSIAGTLDTSIGTIEFAPSDTSGFIVPLLNYHHLALNKAGNVFTPATGTLAVLGDLNLVAGTLNLNTNNSTTTVSGSLTIGGTLNASAASPLTVAKNLTINGTFNHNNGAVILNTNASSTVAGSGSIGFYNFTADAPGKVLAFKSGSPIAFANSLKLAGSSGDPLIAQSADASQWLINLSGSVTVSYIRLANAGCFAGTRHISLTDDIYDGGNNDWTCWKFKLRGGGGGGGAFSYHFDAIELPDGGGETKTGGGESGGAGASTPPVEQGGGGGETQTGGSQGGGGGAAP